jgi:glycosyltransferase involved in cell wall biosynthesis
MKILHTVEFYHPSVGGMQEVVKQLSERLVAMGHDVTVATTRLSERQSQVLNGVKIVEFEISGNAVRGMIGETQRYVDYLVNSDFDVITSFAAQQWATDLTLDVLDRIKAKKVFVPTGFSGLYDEHYHGYFEKMKTWMKGYDMNVFLSDDYRDVNFAKANGIEKRILIPNGAGEDEFLKPSPIDVRGMLGIGPDDLLVLNVGSHTGVKGHREAIEIFQKANLPSGATLLIIGNDLGGGCTKECKKRARLFGWCLFGRNRSKRLIVREMTRPETVAAYQQANIFLFPSNLECSPIVLFECMAAKTPFLTSDVGNAKEIIGWSHSGRLMPTDKESSGYGMGHVKIGPSAELLSMLAADVVGREQLAEAGYAAWREKYSWEKITKAYEGLYASLI